MELGDRRSVFSQPAGAGSPAGLSVGCYHVGCLGELPALSQLAQRCWGCRCHPWFPLSSYDLQMSVSQRPALKLFKNNLWTLKTVVMGERRQFLSWRPQFAALSCVCALRQSWRCWWKLRAVWTLLKLRTWESQKQMLGPSLDTGIDLAVVNWVY